MALQWADTFNIYGTNTAFMTNGLYAQADSVTLLADPDPTATGNVIRYDWNSVTESALRFVLSANKTTLGWAKRMWFAALPSSNPVQIMSFNDASNTANVAIHVTSTGALLVTAGKNSSSTALGTSPVAIAANGWNHIEVKVLFSTTVGTVDIRVNGSPVYSLSGVNTAPTTNAFCSQVVCSGNATVGTRAWNSVCYDKDFVLWDTSGSFNNTFLGPVQCLDTLTDGDSSLTWTPNSGSTGFNILAHIPPQDDSSYIGAATALTSTFTLANLPSNVSSVRGNVMKLRARKIDGGDGNTQVGLKSGASTSLGANRAITTAYTYWFDVNETDPATGAQWTPVAFNSAIFQLARTV